MLCAILDTNIFVGGGFNRRSASARLLRAAADGDLQVIWCEATRAETQRILTKIPPLSWTVVADFFRPDGEWTAPLDLAAVDFVTDPDDRLFAALSVQAGVPVVSADDDLLTHVRRLDVWPPGPFLRERLPGLVS